MEFCHFFLSVMFIVLTVDQSLLYDIIAGFK